jgi:DNA gyrase subunit A
MATSIPPHNLNEVCDAILHLAEHPDATSEDMLQFVKGPDFPTGGVIYDKKAIAQTYLTGRGAVLTRAKADIEERKKGQFDIIITEIPYQVNKSELVKKMAELVTDKKIEGIRDIRDESDREGLRIVIELKTEVPPQKVLNQLYKHTDLQKDFHMNMIALVGGIEPRLLSLRDVLVEYVAYRKIVIRRRTEYDLARAEDRAHILEGLVKALDHIDEVIQTIKKSGSRDEAHANLMKKFDLSDRQTTAILEMRLQSLAALERKKVEDELKEIRSLIKDLKFILAHPEKIVEIMKTEVEGLKTQYGDERRTKVVATGIGDFKDEDLIPDEEAVITLSSGGYVKRLPPDTFRIQKRGGTGLIGSDVMEEDFLEHFVSATTHDNILFFTDKGRVFQTKVYDIPAASRTSKGRAIHNFLELPGDEKVSAIVAYREGAKESSKFLIMITKEGVVKKTALKDFSNIRKTGIIAITLKKGDSLMGVKLSSGDDDIIITTAQGQSIRFKESQARPMGRSASGIKAITLKKSHDAVAGFGIIPHDKAGEKKLRLFVIMANGFGKQTPVSEYKTQNRGGSGIRTANVTPKTGPLIAAQVIGEELEVIALSAKGQVIRTELASVRETGRATQGVRIMQLHTGDRVAGVVVL